LRTLRTSSSTATFRFRNARSLPVYVVMPLSLRAGIEAHAEDQARPFFNRISARSDSLAQSAGRRFTSSESTSIRGSDARRHGRAQCLRQRQAAKQSEAPYFDPQTVEAIAKAVGAPYDLLVSVLGTCGLRWGEVAALRCRRVDMLRHRLLVEESLAEVSGQLIFGSTKSNAHRSVPVPKTLMKRVAAALEGKGPDELVFTSPQGGPLRYRNFLGRVWHPNLKRLGLSVVGIHTLRHSPAARIVAAGGSAKTLQVVLGHRSADFSLTTYAHLFDADLDDLAERLERSGVKSG
jgi:integrase